MGNSPCQEEASGLGLFTQHYLIGDLDISVPWERIAKLEKKLSDSSMRRERQCQWRVKSCSLGQPHVNRTGVLSLQRGWKSHVGLPCAQ